MQGERYCLDACEARCSLAEECIQPQKPVPRPTVKRAWEIVVLAFGETDGWSARQVDLRFCVDLLTGSGVRGAELLVMVGQCKAAASEIREIAEAVQELEKAKDEAKREAQSRH